MTWFTTILSFELNSVANRAGVSRPLMTAFNNRPLNFFWVEFLLKKKNKLHLEKSRKNITENVWTRWRGSQQKIFKDYEKPVRFPSKL